MSEQQQETTGLLIELGPTGRCQLMSASQPRTDGAFRILDSVGESDDPCLLVLEREQPTTYWLSESMSHI